MDTALDDKSSLAYVTVCSELPKINVRILVENMMTLKHNVRR